MAMKFGTIWAITWP